MAFLLFLVPVFGGLVTVFLLTDSDRARTASAVVTIALLGAVLVAVALALG